MEAVAALHAAAEAFIADLERHRQDPEKLKQAIDDKNRFEYEAWKAAGCPNMKAKDGDELREWRKVGFPMWYMVKSMETLEPVQKREQTKDGDGNPDNRSKSSEAAETSTEVMVETAFGRRKAIANTRLPAGKHTVLGGGPLVEYTFDDTYREEQKAYMKANGLKGLSASRWA